MKSWKHKQNIKLVVSDSGILENTMEVTVFHLFVNLSLIAWKCWWIWIGHTKIEGNTSF